MQKHIADLHVHTALSPCADESCTPGRIITAAIERGITMLVVTDHNSAENLISMIHCGERLGVAVIPGMEVMTREEAHLICLLDGVESAVRLQDAIYALLPQCANDPVSIGHQTVFDDCGRPVGECERMLIGAADIAMDDVVGMVHGMNGLVIAAHVDRPAFSVISSLGWVPRETGFDALEISASLTREEAISRFPEISDWPIVTGSDAHTPERVGEGPTLFLLKEPTLSEIALALRGVGEREFLIL